MKIVIALLCVLGGVFASQVRFDGYEVHRVTPSNEDQLKALRTLEESNKYNFWSDVSIVNANVDIMVPPHLKQEFKEFACGQNLDVELYIDNVQGRIDNEKQASLRSPQARDFGWTSYYRLNEIYAWLDDLAKQYPDIVSIVVAGSSYENRQVRGVRVSYSASNYKNAIFLEAGIHAREWIGPAVVTFMLNEILTSTDPAVRKMAESHDWYIFPVFNPDGYEYTHTTNRVWRKTRVPYGNGCYGADPNRNWGYKWNTGGASNNPCSDTFAGPYAFSEPCTNSTSQFITSIGDRLSAYIAFHSYSQMILIPYGHSVQHTENFDELYDVGLKGAASLAKRYGTKYKVGNIAETIYVASGGSMDWAKGTQKTRITYTYELRDTGRHGFILPADQIIPSGWETLDSLVTMLDEFSERK